MTSAGVGLFASAASAARSCARRCFFACFAFCLRSRADTCRRCSPEEVSCAWAGEEGRGGCGAGGAGAGGTGCCGGCEAEYVEDGKDAFVFVHVLDVPLGVDCDGCVCFGSCCCVGLGLGLGVVVVAAVELTRGLLSSDPKVVANAKAQAVSKSPPACKRNPVKRSRSYM